jgi:plastocyanin
MSRCVAALIAVAWLGAVGLAGRASAGDVVGLVRLKGTVTPEKDRKRYPVNDSNKSAEPAPSPLTDVVIFLEGAKSGTGAHPPPVMAQQHKTFRPTMLPVKVGTAVSFPNKDAFFHNVFSYSKLKRFDLGRYPAGESRSITFEQVGLVKVFCEIHSHMKASILVLDTDAFTVANGQGFFKLTGVRPGKYRLVAWHPAFDPVTRDVEVRDGATEVEIEL